MYEEQYLLIWFLHVVLKDSIIVHNSSAHLSLHFTQFFCKRQELPYAENMTFFIVDIITFLFT